MANFIETDMLPVSKYLATSKILKVPEFQRSYAWTEDEVSQLWDDVVEAIDNKKSEYFIGPIVVKNNEQSLEVIDGQQRLTTSLILIRIFGVRVTFICYHWEYQGSELLIFPIS